tara:strand:+ start:16855 stop:17616 length:762 start_codon:yes stop_codon:yes gene_type:complete
MKINIKNVKDILNLKINMQRRGILITILLLKDDSPKVTLAKCRASFNMTKTKEDLIWLHENTFIKWSGYSRAKKSIEVKELEPEVIEIIDFMNNLYKRKFSPSSGKTRPNILSRLNYHSVEDIKKVISNRYAVWKDDAMMGKYLQPSTIFNASKFDKYLEEVNHTREGESFVNASNLNLEDGTEITLKIAKELIDTDTYNLRMFSTDGEGNKRGVSKTITRYGKDIKKLIHVQDSNEKYNGVREYLYYYNTKT